jgi:hypothetical protein
MKLALGIALVLCTAACKKDEKKKEAPAAGAKKEEAPKPETPPPEAAAALSGFQAAAEADPPKSGQIAGLGGKIGDLFGGAAASATELPPPAARGGDCDSVADRLMLVMKAYVEGQLTALTDEEREAAKGMIDGELAGMRPQLLAMCTDEKWSQELRDCALTAASMDAFDACGQFAPAGSALAAEAPATPAPAWTGGDSCKDVGLRLTQLATVSMGGLDPAMKAEMEQALAESAKQMEEACTTGNWNAEVRKCMVDAAAIDDVTPCFEKLGI